MMPQRLGANYISQIIQKNTLLLHRAILGSLERFIGILIENHQARLTFLVIAISDKYFDNN